MFFGYICKKLLYNITFLNNPIAANSALRGNMKILLSKEKSPQQIGRAIFYCLQWVIYNAFRRVFVYPKEILEKAKVQKRDFKALDLDLYMLNPLIIANISTN